MKQESAIRLGGQHRPVLHEGEQLFFLEAGQFHHQVVRIGLGFLGGLLGDEAVLGVVPLLRQCLKKLSNLLMLFYFLGLVRREGVRFSLIVQEGVPESTFRGGRLRFAEAKPGQQLVKPVAVFEG